VLVVVLLGLDVEDVGTGDVEDVGPKSAEGDVDERGEPLIEQVAGEVEGKARLGPASVSTGRLPQPGSIEAFASGRVAANQRTPGLSD
jgi:hypothetical protein